MSLSASHLRRLWHVSGSSMRSSSSQASLRAILSKELSEIRSAGTYKTERVITTPQAAAIQVQEREGRLLNFCANNYLGLSVSRFIPSVCVCGRYRSINLWRYTFLLASSPGHTHFNIEKWVWPGDEATFLLSQQLDLICSVLKSYGQNVCHVKI